MVFVDVEVEAFGEVSFVYYCIPCMPPVFLTGWLRAIWRSIAFSFGLGNSIITFLLLAVYLSSGLLQVLADIATKEGLE